MDMENKEPAANNRSVSFKSFLAALRSHLPRWQKLINDSTQVNPNSKLHNIENSLVLAALLENLFNAVMKKVS